MIRFPLWLANENDSIVLACCKNCGETKLLSDPCGFDHYAAIMEAPAELRDALNQKSKEEDGMSDANPSDEAAIEHKPPLLEYPLPLSNGVWVTAQDAYGTSLAVHKTELAARRYAGRNPGNQAYWLPSSIALPVMRHA